MQIFHAVPQQPLQSSTDRGQTPGTPPEWANEGPAQGPPREPPNKQETAQPNSSSEGVHVAAPPILHLPFFCCFFCSAYLQASSVSCSQHQFSSWVYEVNCPAERILILFLFVIFFHALLLFLPPEVHEAASSLEFPVSCPAKDMLVLSNRRFIFPPFVWF